MTLPCLMPRALSHSLAWAVLPLLRRKHWPSLLLAACYRGDSGRVPPAGDGMGRARLGWFGVSIAMLVDRVLWVSPAS
eukprot:11569169-Alexandrium_andersonii.AAC.1